MEGKVQTLYIYLLCHLWMDVQGQSLIISVSLVSVKLTWKANRVVDVESSNILCLWRHDCFCAIMTTVIPHFKNLFYEF